MVSTNPDWLVITEAVALSRVSRSTLRRWLAAGAVRFSRPCKRLLISRASLLDHLEKHARGGDHVERQPAAS